MRTLGRLHSETKRDAVKVIEALCIAVLGLIAIAPAKAAAPSPVHKQLLRCGGDTVADYNASLVPPASAFLTSLQQALTRGDRAAIASMLRYPVLVGGVRGIHSVVTPAQFLRHYSSIMTSGVKAAVMGQSAECLFANWRGVMIGKGEVWIEVGLNKNLKIETFNVH